MGMWALIPAANDGRPRAVPRQPRHETSIMLNLTTLSLTPLSLTPPDTIANLSDWARGNGLEIVMLVTGAMLLTRLTTWLRGKITRRIDAASHDPDAVVRSEASKHRHALAQVFTWAALVIIYCVTAAAVATRIGIPITSLVAPAALVAVALGFGAQRIVQDILAGFFIIAERQYGDRKR